MSLPVLGVNGWLNCSGLGDVLGKSGHMDASSSAMKVDCDGDVVSDSGSCRNAASEPLLTKLFIFTDTQFAFTSSELFTSRKFESK